MLRTVSSRLETTMKPFSLANCLSSHKFGDHCKKNANSWSTLQNHELCYLSMLLNIPNEYWYLHYVNYKLLSKLFERLIFWQTIDYSTVNRRFQSLHSVYSAHHSTEPRCSNKWRHTIGGHTAVIWQFMLF